MMVMLGTDAHKRSHTIVAVDPAGVEIGSVTVAATTDGHLRAMQWAAKYTERQWAIEDCRASSRRLEGDLSSWGTKPSCATSAVHGATWLHRGHSCALWGDEGASVLQLCFRMRG